MSKNYSPLNFSNLLTLLFIGLKLTNTIKWSWWWVLCPIWLDFVIGLFIIIAVATYIKIKEK